MCPQNPPLHPFRLPFFFLELFLFFIFPSSVFFLQGGLALEGGTDTQRRRLPSSCHLLCPYPEDLSLACAQGAEVAESEPVSQG